MKTYLRILRYAPHLGPRMAQFFIYSLVGTLFSAIYVGLIFPLMKLLFSDEISAAVPEIPQFAFSKEYGEKFLKHHFLKLVNEHGKVETLLYVCIGIVICVFVANVFRYMERMAASRIRVDIVKNMRMDIFSNVTRLHIGYFNDQRRGDLVSRFTNDMSEVENSVGGVLKSVFKDPLTIIIYIVILFTISVKLTLFTLILLPVTGGIVGEIIKRLRRKSKQSQEAMGRIVNILDETFGGMRVIQAFNARNFILKKMEADTSYHRKVNLSISRKNELSSPLSEFLGVIIVALIMYFGGQLVLDGKSLQPEVFLTYLTFYAMLITPAKTFSNSITSLQKGTVSAQRIFTVTDLEPAIKDQPDAVKVNGFTDSIEFRNVTFAYDQTPVLKNISLKIEKGKTVALVGSSGGGKTTLADLIPRFYDPTEGAVLLDNVDIRKIEIDSVRRLMGIVTQESILFNDTIFNNISFGMEGATEEAVIAAAKVANAHDFITQTEMGYDTVIGERGSKLSGGQRQRLAIARAVLKNPPILILDEATSALDSESERLVQEAITNLMKNRTSVVIAHRLSTIQHADEILVIQDGAIVERGTHQQLVDKNGVYRKLSDIQKT